MLIKDGNVIAGIYVNWDRNHIRMKYLTPPKSEPIDAHLKFAAADSAIAFLGILSAILSSDYEVSYAENTRATVLEIIAWQFWQVAKDPPPRPLVIEIKIYPANRIMFFSFYRYESAEGGKVSCRPLMIEFLTKKNLLKALDFLDDLLEENSSSAKNNLDKIGRAVNQRAADPQKMIYTLPKTSKQLFGI